MIIEYFGFAFVCLSILVN